MTEYHTGRKDSHIKTLNTLKIALKRELEELIKKEKPEFCCERELEEEALKRLLDLKEGPTSAQGMWGEQAHVEDGTYKAQSPAEIVAKIAEEFDNMLESHCSRDAKWYNDDAKYRYSHITPHSSGLSSR